MWRLSRCTVSHAVGAAAYTGVSRTTRASQRSCYTGPDVVHQQYSTREYKSGPNHANHRHLHNKSHRQAPSLNHRCDVVGLVHCRYSERLNGKRALPANHAAASKSSKSICGRAPGPAPAPLPAFCSRSISWLDLQVRWQAATGQVMAAS